jgi:hypothetical protein
LLACATLLISGEVEAQARGAPAARSGKEPAPGRAATVEKLDAWLRRLAGRFRMSRTGQSIGEADCVGIGDGPGVHCIFRLARPGWEDRWGVQVRLFGLDLDAPGIGYLQLNGDSTAAGGVATLQGDAITFRGDCPIIQPERSGATIVTVTECRQELWIHAPPDRRSVRIRNRVYQHVLVSLPRGRPVRRQVSGTVEWVLEPVSGADRRN